MNFTNWNTSQTAPFDLDKAREAINKFQQERGNQTFPDEYVCTSEKWEKLKGSSKTEHTQDEPTSGFGIPVRIFDTMEECINYRLAARINGKKVQLLYSNSQL